MIEDCKEKTDEELVKIILEDQNYFACLIQHYQGRLLNYARKITNLPDTEIEDILQDVFIKIYKNLNNFNPDLKFSSWIYRITHNHIISNFRKINARPKTVSIGIDDNFLENIASDMDTGKYVDIGYLRENINKILDKLDLKYKEVLVLKFLENKNYNEISDILKKPIGTVGTLINRAKAKFKKELIDNNIKF
ncbi:MAG: sigma-70 family RNA polymerase sigma factor [bacterium]